MRYVALSVRPGRINKLRKFLPQVEVFEGASGCHEDYRQECIPLSYRDAAVHAFTQGWDKGVVFMQDDVWLPHGGGFDAWMSEYSEPLVVLGQTEPNGIVIPKAYFCEPFVWEILTRTWTGEGRIGPAWMPVVSEYGVVLDVCRQL